MYNPGYIMIDCKGLDLTKGSTPQTITGIYDKLQDALMAKKETLACHCVWGDTGPVTPISVLLTTPAENTIVATASTLQVVVTSEDVVTIVNMAPAE